MRHQNMNSSSARARSYTRSGKPSHSQSRSRACRAPVRSLRSSDHSHRCRISACLEDQSSARRSRRCRSDVPRSSVTNSNHRCPDARRALACGRPDGISPDQSDGRRHRRFNRPGAASWELRSVVEARPRQVDWGFAHNGSLALTLPQCWRRAARLKSVLAKISRACRSYQIDVGMLGSRNSVLGPTASPLP